MNEKTHEGLLTIRTFKRFVLVTIFIVIITSLTDVIDGFYLLSYINSPEVPAMAAKSINGTLLKFGIIFPTLIMVGNQKRYANQVAKGHTDIASKIFSWSIMITLFYSLIVLFVNFFLAQQIAQYMGKDNPNLVSVATEIIKGAALGLPFVFLNLVISPIILIDGGRKILLASLFSTVVADIIGNTLVVTVFKGGAFDIMLASSIAHFISVLVLMLHFFKKRKILIFSFHLKDIKLTKQVFIKGTSGGISKGSIALISLYINFALLHLGGQTALNVWGMQQQVLMLIEDITNGILKCAFLIQYIYFAEEDLKSMDRLFHLLLKIIFIFVTLMCAAVLCFISLFIKQYGPGDINEQTLLIIALISCAILIPFDALMQSTIVFSSLKRCNIIYFLSLFVFPLLFTIPFYLSDNLTGFIIGYAVGRSVYPLFHLLAAIIKYKEVPSDAKRMFFMDKDMGYEDKDYIDVKINGIEDCRAINNLVLKFCKAHNLDDKQTNVLASCAEEISNIYLNSCKKENLKNQYCSIRICIKKNKILFRMKDDCPFYLIDENRKLIEKDPARNVGYKILLSNAKDIIFTHFFGINNFIVKL